MGGLEPQNQNDMNKKQIKTTRAYEAAEANYRKVMQEKSHLHTKAAEKRKMDKAYEAQAKAWK